MGIIQRAWSALSAAYLGGELLSTSGSVRGEPAMGTTADPQKATGEVRVHVVKSADGTPRVTLELLQADTPGDSPQLICVRLDPDEAGRLGAMLFQASATVARDAAAPPVEPEAE